MKRGTINRKDTARSRVKTLRRTRRQAIYTIVSNDGRVMRGRIIMRDGTLALVRVI